MQDSDELVAIDLATQTVKWRTPTGAMPADVYGTADDKTLLVGLTGGEGVEVYDVSGKTPVRTKVISTGKGSHAFRAAGDKRHVFVSNRVGNTISKIDLQTFESVATYPGPGGPDCMDVSADGKLLLVSSQVNVGRSPHGVWTLDHAAR
jgi:DNA-binding beta-propeller fold protein YncE